jgi:hypothetical protein
MDFYKVKKKMKLFIILLTFAPEAFVKANGLNSSDKDFNYVKKREFNTNRIDGGNHQNIDLGLGELFKSKLMIYFLYRV